MAQNLRLSQACSGLIQYKTATGKSPHTIAEYGVTFKKLLGYFDDDPPIVPKLFNDIGYKSLLTRSVPN